MCVDIYQDIKAVSLADSRVLKISSLEILKDTVGGLDPYILAIWSVPDGVVIQLHLRKGGSFFAAQLSYTGQKIWMLGPNLTLDLGCLAIEQDSVFENIVH